MLLTQFAVSFPLHPLLKESISVKYAIPKNFLAAWQRGNKSLFSEKQMSIQFKRISHHSTKFVEFFVTEHHALYQTCGKVNLFISIRNLFSTRLFF